MENHKVYISVVMPVYNGERFLAQAIESILRQTYPHFEFLIINDGSTDSTGEILQQYQQQDTRIRVIDCQQNTGLVAALNMGCQQAKGKYIARMDADDISLPERFERQVCYLENHPEIGILGTQAAVINDRGEIINRIYAPCPPELVIWEQLFHNRQIHPSVMMRWEIIASLHFYDEKTFLTEDYDLWLRASFVCKVANLPDILLLYRLWEQNISVQKRSKQMEQIVSVMQVHLKRFLTYPVSFKTAMLMRWLADPPAGIPPENMNDIRLLKEITLDLYKAYQTNFQVESLYLIKRDIAKKFYRLGFVAWQYSISLSLMLLWQATRFSPALLPLYLLKKFQL